MSINKLKNFFIILLAFIFLQNCSFLSKKNESNEGEENKVINKKKRIEPNVYEKAQDNIDAGGSIIFGKKQEDKFANQNILWRATLEVFENFPISLADYTGSIISTDWYSPGNSKDSIKIKVEFLSSELRVSSVKVTSFKKTCKNIDEKCSVSRTADNFNDTIRDEIFQKVRFLNNSKQ
jgi:hypothetical protein